MMGSAPCPWVIADRTGHATVCGTRVDWLAEWRGRIRAIEAADRPVQHRREGLDRMLMANAGAFRTLLQHGALDAVIEVTGAAAAADGRLSWLEFSVEIAA
jgi:hypothetical protein